MPSRKSGTTRRKHSLGNLRRAHPASGATWNVQVVRGKMSSKCLWHACRALILGLTLMLLGAGMATIGYYADQLSVGSEVRGNATVRVKNESKGFHLNNLSYVGPIVMGFGGFIVVASCVMTFEARDSAAKVVPARLKATSNSKTTVRSNQSSATSQRRAAGIQHQATRWDHHLGVFRSSPAEPLALPAAPLDRQALTAALVHFSKSISTSARFSPQHRRLSHTGSVPNLSTIAPHPYANSTSISQLLSPNRKSLYPAQKRHRHHHHHHPHTSSNGRQMKSRGTRISSSLVARNTRESSTALLAQQMPLRHRLYWHAMSIDANGRATTDSQASRITDRTKRSDTAKRHVFTRQKPIEQDEEQRRTVEAPSPLAKRRSSTLSDSSYSGRWTYRCASITSRASSIDSRKVQVDLHSPDTVPKSILRSPKRFNSGTSTTPSVEKELRSQLSVCSEPPVPIRQLSGQSSLEPCLREESPPDAEEVAALCPDASAELSSLSSLSSLPQSTLNATNTSPAPADTPAPASSAVNGKKPRPATLPLNIEPSLNSNVTDKRSFELHDEPRAFYRAKPNASLDGNDDSTIFYVKSSEKTQTNGSDDSYDSLRVISERRHKLLKTGSETALSERKANYDPSEKPNGATQPESVWVELRSDVRPEQPELARRECEESSVSVALTMESTQESAMPAESNLL